MLFVLNQLLPMCYINYLDVMFSQYFYATSYHTCVCISSNSDFWHLCKLADKNIVNLHSIWSDLAVPFLWYISLYYYQFAIQSGTLQYCINFDVL